MSGMVLRNYLTTGQDMPKLQAGDTVETRHGQWAIAPVTEMSHVDRKGLSYRVTKTPWLGNSTRHTPREKHVRKKKKMRTAIWVAKPWE